MVETGAIPDQSKERIAQIGSVDLVVGFVDQKAAENLDQIVSTVRGGLAGLSAPVRTVLVHRDATTIPAVSEGDDLRLLTYSQTAPEPSLAIGIFNAYRTIWGMAEKLNARACAVLASAVDTFTPHWIEGLVQPVLERDFDLVTPCYAPRKFEGLLNSGILAPLTHALYGKQLENPLGPDSGCSARVFKNLLQVDPSRARATGPHQLVPIGPAAIVKGFRVCQARLGARIFPPVDWKNLSSILVEVLGPMFVDIERDAAFWQRIRYSEPVLTFGAPLSPTEENIAVDVRPLLEPFRLGFRNLQDIWGLVLPPTTLFELKKANDAPPEQFRIPDTLWARTIYDFALAHRLRTIGRDHLLGALTPLYLGWVASYALEVDSLAPPAVGKRLERLYSAYETSKPYFVSRWRWPDRFNP